MCSFSAKLLSQCASCWIIVNIGSSYPIPAPHPTLLDEDNKHDCLAFFLVAIRTMDQQIYIEASRVTDISSVLLTDWQIWLLDLWLTVKNRFQLELWQSSLGVSEAVMLLGGLESGVCYLYIVPVGFVCIVAMYVHVHVYSFQDTKGENWNIHVL